MLGKKRLTAAAILALSAALPSGAQVGDADERTPVDCLTMSRVRKEVVVDGATILYFLKDGRMYVNRLHEVCPGLKEFGPNYSSRLYGGGLRVCAGDRIWPKRGSRENLPGDEYALTVTVQCPLGPFHAVSEEEAEEMQNPGARRAISITPVPSDEERAKDDAQRP